MLTFASPLYLWGLLALAVPVALHLLRLRRTRREVVFPSVRHLRMTRLPQEGHRRLRQWLLLLTRLAAMASACLLLARPSLTRTTPPGADGARHDRRAVIVLDLSASMATGERLQRALALVRQRTDELLAEGTVGLAVTGVPEAAPQEPTAERWRLEEALSSLEASHATGDPGVAIRQALAWLQGATDRRLLVVSDFQALDWERRWQLVPPEVGLELHDVREPESVAEQGGCGIAEVSSARVSERRIRVQVTLVSASPREERRTLTVEAGGVSQTQEVTLPPGGRLRPVVVLDGVAPGAEGEARLSPDGFPRDDAACFWADGVPPRQVLLAIVGERDSLSSAEAAFVGTALESVGEGAARRFVTTVKEIELLEPEELAQQDALLLLGSAARLQSVMDEPVRQLLSRGGLVLATPGDAPGDELRCLSRLGLEFGDYRGQAGRGADGLPDDGIAAVASGSVLHGLFPKVSESDLFRFTIRRHSRLRPASRAQVHLTGLSGDPLLVECQAGQGRGLWLAFNLAPPASDFQLTSAFLPLLQELLLTVTRPGAGLRRLVCGQQAEDSAGFGIDTTCPGLYRDGTALVEVNADRREADRRHLDVAEMRELLLDDHDRQNAGQGALPPDSGRGWSAWLAAALGVAFLLELLLAFLKDRRQLSPRRRQEGTP